MYIDTNIFIYLFEKHPIFGLVVAKNITDFKDRSGLVTSSITISECLAKTALVSLDTFHKFPDLKTVPVDEVIAVHSAELQEKQSIRIGDSIHLATAIQTGCNLFFTNDKKLATVAGRYMKVMLLSDYVSAP